MRGAWIPSRFKTPQYRERGINFLKLSSSSDEDLRFTYPRRSERKTDAKDKPGIEFPLEKMFSTMKRTGLPKRKDQNRWLANHVIDFYNSCVMLHSCFTDCCTEKTCRTMHAGECTYLWADGEKTKTPQQCSAPVYISQFFGWVEKKLNDEHCFPIQDGSKYPRNFTSIAKTILKKLFRVYAHLYCAHFAESRRLGIDMQLHVSFAQLAHFVLQHKLIRTKDTLPMKPLLDLWKGKGRRKKNGKPRAATMKASDEDSTKQRRCSYFAQSMSDLRPSSAPPRSSILMLENKENSFMGSAFESSIENSA
mmetsp:Transcript_4999/g.9540  ORF Transcript_4999/g.9540 Transcript_4999/m.9540 type:complete len:307 (-) Transcript_4999:164-1084(-)